MFPTTLAAMGVTIEGDRLALGVNLFSDEQTLTEQYGRKGLDKELMKKSKFLRLTREKILMRNGLMSWLFYMR